jgi:hypothetical protein
MVEAESRSSLGGLGMSRKKFTIIGPVSMEPLWEPVEKHAAALGWAVISWCQLYEELALLFATLATPDNKVAAFAAWHQVRSDRTQRHMLRALVDHSETSRICARTSSGP